ncbi:unnamed protein product [Owenia fusiformis]|nr:unnamed protein product [Owenia fusiformis]
MWIKELRCLLVLLALVRADPNYDTKHAVIDGDLYIVAVFGLRLKGCTDIRTNSGYQYIDSVVLALKEINKQKDQFRDLGVKIGAIILDDCKDGSRGVQMVKDIYDGNWVIRDNTNAAINVSSIIGFVGSSNSDKTIQLANYLKTKQAALVAPFASSPQLSDRTRFPYFVRTIPSDDKQGHAISAMLIKVGWLNVQVVIEEGSTYASDLAQKFKEAFVNEDQMRCITATYHLQNNTLSAQEIIKAIISSTSKTDVVVVIGRQNYIKSLLQAKKNHPEAKRLVFVGSETWAHAEHIVEGVEEAAMGSVSIAIYGEDVQAFDKHLASLRYNTTQNPFFNMYFEDMFKCGEGENKTSCDVTKNVTGLLHYSQDTYVIHVINAVYALSRATAERLTEKCKQEGVTTVCDSFKEGNIGEDLTKKMEEMSFMDINNRDFEMKDRESVDEYDFFYWQLDGTPMKIGKLTTSDVFYGANAQNFPKGDFYDKQPESQCSTSGSSAIYMTGVLFAMISTLWIIF